MQERALFEHFVCILFSNLVVLKRTGFFFFNFFILVVEANVQRPQLRPLHNDGRHRALDVFHMFFLLLN